MRIKLRERKRVRANDYGKLFDYQSKEWKIKRNEIRIRDEYLCQECKRNGKIAVGTQVDHIKSIKRGGSRLDNSNLELLCKPCHDSKSAKEVRR